MNLQSLKVFAALSFLSFLLSSCSTTGDVVNPTVGQQDKLDVQWGLPPRQAKGTPRKATAQVDPLNTVPATASVPEVTPMPVIRPAPLSTPSGQQQALPGTIGPAGAR